LQIHKQPVHVYDVVTSTIITATCVRSNDWKDQCCL